MITTPPDTKPFRTIQLRGLLSAALAVCGGLACGGPGEEPLETTSAAVIYGARGRPRIADNTVVTDRGELLRGAFWPLDTMRGVLPTRNQLRAMKSQGLNTLHLYAETWAFGEPAGIHRAKVDTLVNWTRSEGLYLVLTIGNGRPELNGTFNRGFARQFWNVYARRYKNDAHVIYELHNEPQIGVPLNAATRSLQRDLFDRVRRNAPASMILVFSYPEFSSGPGVVQDANWMRNNTTLNWNNAAISFHGYARPESRTTSTLNYVIARGIPVIQTEFFDTQQWLATNQRVWRANAAQTELYEQTRTSWLTFLPVNEITIASKFRSVMDSNWIVWGADFGTWPATNAPPLHQTISLKVPTNNRFIVAENAGASPLIANRTAAGPWERFVVVPVGASDVALRAAINSRYVTTRSGNLIANQSRITSRERFEWLRKPNGSILLRSRGNNRFVSADFNRGNPPRLFADRPKAGPWEWFAQCDSRGRACSR